MMVKDADDGDARAHVCFFVQWQVNVLERRSTRLRFRCGFAIAMQRTWYGFRALSDDEMLNRARYVVAVAALLCGCAAMCVCVNAVRDTWCSYEALHNVRQSALERKCVRAGFGTRVYCAERCNAVMMSVGVCAGIEN